MTAFMSVKTGIAAALFGVVAIAAATPADARIRACTNAEIRTIVTDAFILNCTGVGGTVKCTDSGKQTCCKQIDGYQICSPNPSTLSGARDPAPYSRPPHVRTDPGPDRVGPPSSPRPPRADPPPSRVGPPASSGPRIK